MILATWRHRYMQVLKCTSHIRVYAVVNINTILAPHAVALTCFILSALVYNI